MIVKIQSGPDEKGWHMLDNLVAIRFSTEPILLEDDEKICEDGIDILLLGNRKSPIRSYAHMIVKDARDTEIHIIFDGVAYICNDSGKTLERVVGYRF